MIYFRKNFTQTYRGKHERGREKDGLSKKKDEREKIEIEISFLLSFLLGHGCYHNDSIWWLSPTTHLKECLYLESMISSFPQTLKPEVATNYDEIKKEGIQEVLSG